ncbi:MAG TPA: hypothetical protein VN541_06245 [Tepidisphaeraceae bacterium]|nr:hypothetical protein [Tepidisphaeraceae bacterium]
MTTPHPSDDQMLRNLAAALREQEKQHETGPQLPPPTDQDILRAMLGKPWGRKSVDSTPVRKAG